jgi:hypothetical protein
MLLAPSAHIAVSLEAGSVGIESNVAVSLTVILRFNYRSSHCSHYVGVGGGVILAVCPGKVVFIRAIRTLGTAM